MGPLIALALALGGPACVPPAALQRDHQTLSRELQKARAQGARQCMPRDMAKAEAHASFAELEFEQADTRRAREHLDVALEHAYAAVAGSAGCTSEDRDGDGVPDVKDACPDTKEDPDGIADDDGCPDADVALPTVALVEDREVVIFVPTGVPTATVGDGDGVHEADDDCPAAMEDVDGHMDGDGCPDPDNDADSILDVVDKCPRDAEDVDGFQDMDGCPEADNDEDGFADADDACPDEAGTGDGCPSRDTDGDGIGDLEDQCLTDPESPNGYLDEDGCPDVKPQGVKLQYGQIMVTQGRLEFDAGGTQLTEASEPILIEVGNLLFDQPELTIRIEGHTDNQGEPTALQIRSQNMAEAVRDFLMEQGVSSDRMEVLGHGGGRPIDTNRTPDGREANTRVELHVTP